MSIVAVGTIGYDTVETQHGGVKEALGGSVSYFALAARFFAPVSIVAAVGTDFRDEDRRLVRRSRSRSARDDRSATVRPFAGTAAITKT